MPVIIPVIFGAFASALVVEAVGLLAASIIGGVVAGSLSRAMAPRQTFLDRGLTDNSSSQTEQIPVIYGSRKMGATRCLLAVSDGAVFTQQYLHQIWAICEGEISAINTVYLNDVASTDSRYVNIPDGFVFEDLVTVEKYVGTETQAASAALIAALPSAWTSAHQGKGVAYVYAKLKWHQGVFQGLPVFTFDIEGKKVWDCRVAGSPSTVTFSDNPALCILDYLINTRYGWGIEPSRVDTASFSDSANYCDQLVSIPASGSPSFSTQKRYTCDGALLPENGRMENMRALLSSCRGNLVFAGGQYRLVLDRASELYQSSPNDVFNFNQNNIIGAWTIHKAGKSEKLNRVKARFFNPDKEWQPDFAVWDDTTDRTQDAGIVLESEIVLPFTADYYRALQLAQLEQKLSRDDLVAEFTATLESIRCEVGDVVTITHSTPGWTDKPFRVTRMELLSSDEVRVTVREYQTASYELDALTASPVIPDTDLPDPFTVSAPTDLEFEQSSSVWDTAILSWTNTDISAVEYQVEYKLANESAYTVMPRIGDTSIAIPRLEARLYDFRVKAINNIGASSSYTSEQGVMDGSTANYVGTNTGTGFLSHADTILHTNLPRGITWAPNTNLVYVNQRGSIDVVNPVNDMIIDTITVGGSPSEILTAISYCPVNGHLYVLTSAETGQNTMLHQIDPVSKQTIHSRRLQTGEVSANPAIYCPVDDRMWFSSIGSGAFTALSAVNPLSSPSNDTEVRVAGSYGDYIYCPFDGKIWATNGNEEVVVISPLTASIETTISLTGNLPTGICYSTVNNRIYVTNFSTHTISVINPQTRAIVATINGGSPTDLLFPFYILYCQDSQLVYVSSTEAPGKLNAIRPDTNSLLQNLQLSDETGRMIYVPSVKKIYILSEDTPFSTLVVSV